LLAVERKDIEMTKQEVLANTDFGHRVAEDEIDALAGYFVETDNWKRLIAGDIDVVYGPKGSGKGCNPPPAQLRH
jgi:hypothetical protein